MASSREGVFVGRGIAKVLSQSEVDEKYHIVNSNHEVVGLDVTMYIAANMKSFQGT